MRQIFDRSDIRSARVLLPEVVRRIEYRSIGLWNEFLDEAMFNRTLHALISSLNDDWFRPWMAVPPPPLAVGETGPDLIASTGQSLQALAVMQQLDGPPDALRLQRLRFGLFSELAWMDETQQRDAAYLLALADAVDGLADEEYLAFTETLLWVASDLLLAQSPAAPEAAPTEANFEEGNPEEFPAPAGAEQGESSDPVDQAEVPGRPGADAESLAELGEAEEATDSAPTAIEETAPPAPRSQLPSLLTQMLPGLSNAFANHFSEVDPRLNANLAAVFDVAQFLLGENPQPERLLALRRDMADAVAQFVLQLRKMSYYYEQPVRSGIAGEIETCLGQAGGADPAGQTAMSREQFEQCLENLVELAAADATREELAGDPDGPFGQDQLQRELLLPPWQRINYAIGYLHERHSVGCDQPAEPLPNPLEWSGLVNTVAWLADSSPVFFQTPENEARIVRLRQQGLQLLQTLTEQVDCFSGENVSDPVYRSLAEYREALDSLVRGLREAELKFREDRLKPGADVVLHGDGAQKTAWRDEELVINPCDAERACGMTGKLAATRALIGLFPDPYLIADQTRMGVIEICYDNVEWVERRSEPVRPEDPFVANYYGRLSFDLVGRYREKDIVTPVFGATFISPGEYHYLFAAATDEVREDACPQEWVGTHIKTGLPKKNGIRVVPDRLTYLAGARSQPSELIRSNWEKGDEWRDGFITGTGVMPHEYPEDSEITDRVAQHLRALYQAEQAELYAALMRPQTRTLRLRAPVSLYELLEELTARKALVRTYINLFYPEFMIASDDIRGALEGYGALLDTVALRRFRESNRAVSAINEEGLARLEAFRSLWTRKPDDVRRSGQVAVGVAHSLVRLNDLYSRYFSNQTAAVTPAGG
jgi:hypothetical protein